MIFKGQERELVDNAERVARFVFEPSMFDKKILAPSAFELAPKLKSGKPEDYLSVSRMALCGEITSASFPYEPRVEGDTFCGYAHLETGTIHAFNQLDTQAFVLVWPTKNSPAHAGIAYRSGTSFVVGKCLDQGVILLTAYLAKLAVVVRFENEEEV